MGDLRQRVHGALKEYLVEGQAALSSLLEADFEEFFVVMNRRAVAYQNFRAIDDSYRGQSFNNADSVQVRRLWQEVDIVNRTLLGLLKEAKASCGVKVLRPVTRSPELASHRKHALRLINGELQG